MRLSCSDGFSLISPSHRIRLRRGGGKRDSSFSMDIQTSVTCTMGSSNRNVNKSIEIAHPYERGWKKRRTDLTTLIPLTCPEYARSAALYSSSSDGWLYRITYWSVISARLDEPISLTRLGSVRLVGHDTYVWPASVNNICSFEGRRWSKDPLFDGLIRDMHALLAWLTDQDLSFRIQVSTLANFLSFSLWSLRRLMKEIRRSHYQKLSLAHLGGLWWKSSWMRKNFSREKLFSEAIKITFISVFRWLIFREDPKYVFIRDYWKRFFLSTSSLYFFQRLFPLVIIAVRLLSDN